MLINGIERTSHGALLLCLEDNFGLNTLGGFKQSFSFAFCYVEPVMSQRVTTNHCPNLLPLSFVQVKTIDRIVDILVVQLKIITQKPMALIGVAS